MDEFKLKWNKTTDGGNFWSDFNASQSDNDLSFFGNSKSPVTPKGDTQINSNFTDYNQWFSSPFSQYSKCNRQ